MCSGGTDDTKQPGVHRCEFTTPHYVDAVNHATANGAQPPDMPKGSWA